MGDRKWFAPPEREFLWTFRFYKHYAATRPADRADGPKCERCWNYSTRVGESSRYPTVCERCVAALEEIEAA